jgi:hypothetical protein
VKLSPQLGFSRSFSPSAETATNGDRFSRRVSSVRARGVCVFPKYEATWRVLIEALWARLMAGASGD